MKVSIIFSFKLRDSSAFFPFFKIQSEHNTSIMIPIWVKCILKCSILRRIKKKAFKYNLLLSLIFPTEMV